MKRLLIQGTIQAIIIWILLYTVMPMIGLGLPEPIPLIIAVILSLVIAAKIRL